MFREGITISPETESDSRIRQYPYGITFDRVNDKFDGPADIHDQVINRPLSIVYNTSHECNLDCEYCFRKDSELPPQSREELLSDMQNLPVGEPMRIVLSGGEPFWRDDIYEVLDFCQKQPWDVLVVSNGTYPIDFDRVPSDVLFEFSLDAPNAEVYKRMRGGTTKQYNQLVANIREARQRGYRVRPCYMMAKVNTTPEILDEIMRFSSELGVDEIRLQRFKPWGGGDELSHKYEFGQEEYQVICRRAVAQAQQYGIGIRVPQNNRFLALGSMYALPDGRVTIQHGDEANQLTLGNLREQTLEQIFAPHKEQLSSAHLKWLVRPERVV